MSAVRARAVCKIMDPALLNALRNFFIGAIPTVVLVLLTFAAYNFLVHRPLTKALAERERRTVGALARAQANIAAAEQKAAEYEQRLREARVAIFKAQEARRKQVLSNRDAAVAEARKRAEEKIQEARATLEQETIAAKSRLQSDAERLAMEIIRTILRPVAAAPAGGGSRS